MNRLPSFSILWLHNVKWLRIKDAHNLGDKPWLGWLQGSQGGKLVPSRRPGVRGLAMCHTPAPPEGPLAGWEPWDLTATLALSL